MFQALKSSIAVTNIAIYYCLKFYVNDNAGDKKQKVLGLWLAWPAGKIDHFSILCLYDHEHLANTYQKIAKVDSKCYQIPINPKNIVKYLWNVA